MIRTAKPKRQCEIGKWQVLKIHPYPAVYKALAKGRVFDNVLCDLCQKEINWRTTAFWRCVCVNHDDA
jgi:hypothetical protein